MTILNPGFFGNDCEGESGERGKRGKRGKRGHRGHDGHDGNDGDTGPTGPTGPTATGTSALLKFSGVVQPSGSPELPQTSFLADWGVGREADAILLSPPSYPSAVSGSLRNMATNLIGFVVPPTATITFELLLNGAPLLGFVIVYAPGEGGIKTVSAGPAAFGVGDTIDIRIINAGGGVPPPFVDASATVGIE